MKVNRSVTLRITPFVLVLLYALIGLIWLISGIASTPPLTAKGQELKSETPTASDDPDKPTATLKATRTRKPTRTRTPTNTESGADFTATVRFTKASIYQANKNFYATATSIAEESELAFGPEKGTLVDNKKGFIAIQNANVKVKNAIITARFYNTPKRLGYFGIIFRDTGFNEQYRVGIDYSGYWHYTYGTTFHRGNTVKGFDKSSTGFNDMQVIVNENVAILFLNGAYVARFDISRVQDAGGISVYAGIYSSQRFLEQETDYENFTVWELP